MRQRRPLSPVLIILLLLGPACHRPAEDQIGGAGGSSGSGGRRQPDGGMGGQGGTEELLGSGGIIPDGGTPDVVAGSGGAKVSCTDSTYMDPLLAGPYVPGGEVKQADDKLGTMSVAEKASQMRGTPMSDEWNRAFETQYTNNAGILQFKFRDGPRGVNMLCERPKPDDLMATTGYSTAFPVAMARGASWDMALEERIGEAMGDETAATGNTMLLAPVVEPLRHPAWGRAQETYGEDVYHLGRMGAAYVTGVQRYVPACAKHYAANNVESQRKSAIAQMDEQTLREIYTRPYGVLVQEAGVSCVMAAYNLIQVDTGTATHCTQNTHLLNDILRKGYGFGYGIILTDWEALPGRNSASIAQEALTATLDIEMPHSNNYAQLESISATATNAQLITDSAKRILQQKYRFKVASPTGAVGLTTPITTFNRDTNIWSIENNQEHIDLALQSALESMVLLKNESSTLPIKSTVKKVAVLSASVGYTCYDTDLRTGTINFAMDKVPRLGDLGSSRVNADPKKSCGMFDGIKEVAAAVNPAINVTSGSSATQAADADMIVVVAGLTPQDEGEEYQNRKGDRSTLGLDATQNSLITSAAALNKPMVVVLEGGSVIDMPWLSNVPAVVMAWYPGQVGGRALGKLLFGQANFSGKLPISWITAADAPPFPFTSGTTTPMEYFVGYRYYEKNAKTPVFPFGHGLSYTKYEYSDLGVPCGDVTSGGVIDVKVSVRNTGTMAGDEVIYVFTSYPDSDDDRLKVKQLKAFYRVNLAAGQGKRVLLKLRMSDLQRWNSTINDWEVAKGKMRISVGSSSTNLPLYDDVTIK